MGKDEVTDRMTSITYGLNTNDTVPLGIDMPFALY